MGYNKHGLSKHPLYGIWRQMMARCYNKKTPEYINYGARGISVCKRWHDVVNFIADVKKPDDSTLSHDRIDNDGNYSPHNMRWTTRTEQSINQRMKKSNKSGVVGVCWHKPTKKWHARIRINKKRMHLGYFVELSDAAAARKAAELKYR